MNNNQMFYSTDIIKYRYKIRKSRTETNAIQLYRLVKIVKKACPRPIKLVGKYAVNYKIQTFNQLRVK